MSKYYITLVNGDKIPFDGAGLGVVAEDILVAKTLDTEDSGKVFVLKADEGVAITLPAPQTGLNYKFVTGLAFDTTSYVITATASVIQGSVTIAGIVIPAINENTITFADDKESLGDWIELICDGTNWYISGQATTALSIVLTDV